MSVAVFDCMHVWAPRTSVRAWRLSACQKCGIVATAHWLRHQSTEVYDKVSACGSYVRETLPSRLTYWDRYWSLLDAYGSTRRLLEVGAGYGFFAAEAAQRGWQVTALEPSSSTIEDSPFRHDIRLVSTTAERLAAEPFDVVVLLDVIEHVSSPVDLLAACRRHVRPGGILMVRTPDARVLFDRPEMPMSRLVWWSLYRNLVYPANPQEHVTHYTPDTLTRLAEYVGMKVLGVYAEEVTRWVRPRGRIAALTFLKFLVARHAVAAKWPYEVTLLAERT